LIGVISDHYSFRPILVVASLIPILAAVSILALIREGAADR
jgi:hypothetical protein